MADATQIELAAHCLRPVLVDARIRGTAVGRANLDLCLFFEARLHPELNALRIATGPTARARVGLERVRLARDEQLESESTRCLEQHLVGGELTRIDRIPGERMLRIGFRAGDGSKRSIVAELFGPQGNWFLLDENDRILTFARRPRGKRSGLELGTKYSPPPTRGEADATPVEPPSDPVAWLEEQADRCTRADAQRAFDELHGQLERSIRRERKTVAGRRRGLEARREAEANAGEVRRDAELLLAQPNPKSRGRASVEVADWFDEGKPRSIELDPKLTLHENAQRAFERARRLEDGAAHTAQQLARIDDQLARLDDAAARLDSVVAQRDLATLRAIASDLQGVVRARQQPKAKGKRRPESRKPYHEFTSREGFPIWVGRTRQDNDTLTLRHARGNDIWLHVGGGIGGSHVVIRLDRGKTASLESLLDAATLALHFSKARGRPEGDVLYTPRKHVRKPKGFPAGRVEVIRSKTLHVRIERDRLRRLLGE